MFVRAGVAADAGEAVPEQPTGETHLSHLRDDRPPRAVLSSEAVDVDRVQAEQMA